MILGWNFDGCVCCKTGFGETCCLGGFLVGVSFDVCFVG